MKRNIAIGFVTYHPDDGVRNRFLEALSCGFTVYIFDNSPENSSIRSLCDENQGMKYTTHGTNVGLGIGISEVCVQAYSGGHSALLFFDQDTLFTADTLNFVEQYYSSNMKSSLDYSVIAFNSRNFSKASTDQGVCFADVLLVINSGSLFILENAKKLKWHNPRYFVDCVDYEFCLKSAKHNLKIGEYSCTPGFDHKSGQGDRIYRIFGRPVPMRPYSVRRVIDSTSASIGLIAKSLLCGQLRFATRLSVLFAGYIASQVLVRVLNFARATKP